MVNSAMEQHLSSSACWRCGRRGSEFARGAARCCAADVRNAHSPPLSGKVVHVGPREESRVS
eukprot:5306370-Lingulodinium_polyedra.AAC.1